MTIVKIELIVLSVIAIVSFVTGVVINIIDLYRDKDIRKNNRHSVDDRYEREIKKIIRKEDPYIDDKTIVDINIPRIKDEEYYELPVIIQNISDDK